MFKRSLRLLIYCMCAVVLLAGCSSNTLKIDAITEDRLEIKLINPENEMLSQHFENNTYTIKDGDNTLLQFKLYPERDLSSYVSTLMTYLKYQCNGYRIASAEYKNGLKYIVIEYDTESGSHTYELIGWIVGSNTGTISTYTTSIDDIRLAIESISISVLDTQQPYSNYYFKRMNDLLALTGG